MDRHPGRLIESDEIAILLDDSLLNRVDLLAGKIVRFLRRLAYRWDADLIAGLNTLVCLTTASVDPYLPGPHEAINQAFRQAFQFAHQHIIQTLTGLIRLHRNNANPLICISIFRFFEVPLGH